MIITLVNWTAIHQDDVIRGVRAVNRQLQEDFRPYWSLDALIRVGGPLAGQLGSPLPSDAVIYLWDQIDVDGVLGYHAETSAELPFGVVFTTVSAEFGQPWTVTLSHEALELVVDAYANTYVAGPAPSNPDKTVFYWYEACDPVQALSYDIDGVSVSDFVLPTYFALGSGAATPTDFLATSTGGEWLPAFGVVSGGYIGYVDPATGETATYQQPDDAVASARQKIKLGLGETARYVRYGVNAESPRGIGAWVPGHGTQAPPRGVPQGPPDVQPPAGGGPQPPQPIGPVRPEAPYPFSGSPRQQPDVQPPVGGGPQPPQPIGPVRPEAPYPFSGSD